MVSGRLSPILRHLRRVIPPREGDGVSDAQLLERFVHENDETAFELLLWRHGPMVWTLCRRILPDFHEAEDAFQAAMLVLARKAGSINKRLSLASWLYKVAFRIALRARADSTRRAKLEKQKRTLPPQVFMPDLGNDVRELRPVIDEGLMQIGGNREDTLGESARSARPMASSPRRSPIDGDARIDSHAADISGRDARGNFVGHAKGGHARLRRVIGRGGHFRA